MPAAFVFSGKLQLRTKGKITRIIFRLSQSLWAFESFNEKYERLWWLRITRSRIRHLWIVRTKD